MKDFKYSYDITRYLKDPAKTAVTSTRYFEISDWLEKNIKEHRIGFILNNRWELCLDDEEVYTLFRLKFLQL